MVESNLPIYLSFSSLFAIWLVLKRWKKQDELPLPPGPPGLPLIGNLLDFPRKNAAPSLALMGKELRELISSKAKDTH